MHQTQLKTRTLGFIGLGAMGSRIAGRLLDEVLARTAPETSPTLPRLAA
jgi:3-hydroxyisobutyrate dehydrogenase-like beta-hydroxyacid dehydrogenase